MRERPANRNSRLVVCIVLKKEYSSDHASSGIGKAVQFPRYVLRLLEGNNAVCREGPIELAHLTPWDGHNRVK